MTKDANYWIHHLDLQPHPEGGYYRQTYRAHLSLPKSGLPPEFSGPRPASTAIYFLLKAGDFSAFHRLRSDELWHFYSGSSVLVHVIAPDGAYSSIHLGPNPEAGEAFQSVVMAGCWFASEIAPQIAENDARPQPNPTPETYALVGCTVAPGFDFDDFELARREALANRYPQHRELITRLTRQLR
jgi:hypothetical protein